MAFDAFDAFRRQQEEIQRAMAAPLESIIRNQRAIDDIVRGPLREVAEAQRRWSEAYKPTAIQITETARAVEQAIQGPLRNIAATQRQVKMALDGPLAQLRNVQNSFVLGGAAPYASLLRNQELILSAMAAAALAAEEEPGEAEEVPWLTEWAAAVADWAPTREQAGELLNALSWLVAMIALGIMMAGPDPASRDVALASVSLLFGAGAIVLKYTNRN
jgi:hypothetical protein